MEDEQKLEVTDETLGLLLSKLNEVNEYLRTEIETVFKLEISKKRFYKLSSINISLANRAIEINKGYISLFQKGNFICAISLLRIQVENCLRLFGFTIMDDMPNCLDKFMAGEEYKNLTGNNGSKLYDSYLAKEIDKVMPEYEFHNTYKQYCKIIHFSGVYQNMNNVFEEKGTGLSVTLHLGGGVGMPHFNILNKIEYTKSMFYSSKIIFRLFQEYRRNTEKILESK